MIKEVLYAGVATADQLWNVFFIDIISLFGYGIEIWKEDTKVLSIL